MEQVAATVDLELDEFSDPERILGAVIGDRFLVLRCIATGGMGVIYLAWQLGLGRHVVLKVIRADRVRRSSRTRFAREAKNLSRVVHPNVVDVHDHGLDRATGLLYIVMEHVGGMTLRQLQRQRGPLPVEAVAAVALPLVAGLAEIHRHGLVHRDMKASNIMLSSPDAVALQVKIVDFGLSKQLEDDQVVTLTSEVVGSHRYIAPEVFKGEVAGPPADVYAIGILLYEMLTGRDRVVTKSPYERLVRSAHGEFTPLDEILPEGHHVPEALISLTHACLHPDPAQRPRDGKVLARYLAAALESVEPDGRPIAEAAERAAPLLPVPSTVALQQIDGRPGGRRPSASSPPPWAWVVAFVLMGATLVFALVAVVLVVQDRARIATPDVVEEAPEPDPYREWALSAMRDGDYDLAVALLSEAIGTSREPSDAVQLLEIATELRGRAALSLDPGAAEPGGTGAIVIAASPRGLAFEVPGVATGFSPSELQGVPVGLHTVRFFAGPDDDPRLVHEEQTQVVAGEIALVYVEIGAAARRSRPSPPESDALSAAPEAALPPPRVLVFVPGRPFREPAIEGADVLVVDSWAELADAFVERRPSAVVAPPAALEQLGLPPRPGVDADGAPVAGYAIVHPRSVRQNRIFRSRAVIGSLDVAGEQGTVRFVTRALDVTQAPTVRRAADAAALGAWLQDETVDAVVVPSDLVEATTADLTVEVDVIDAPGAPAVIAAAVLDPLRAEEPVRALAPALGVTAWSR